MGGFLPWKANLNTGISGVFFVAALAVWLAMQGLRFLVLIWLAAMLLCTPGHAQLPQAGKNVIATSLIPETAIMRGANSGHDS